ncbi:MAG TPA: sulfatase-like hydrolase/transferase [Candidatus Binataceae bacterium]|nr:sulfatase-like hydrolase/transferase [Candidatus Binataceae bacterium]
MSADRPNIVFILADDLGYGDFGCFNYGISRTPAIDQLVREGVCLTQHYSASPVCAPARASLLTGRYPHRTGAIDTFHMRGLDRIALRETTLGDLLKARGYVTGLVGKWHNGAIDPRYHPNRRGFDEFAGFRAGGQDYWNWRMDRNGSFSKADGRYLTDVFTAEALEFLRRHRAEPFFLWLCYNAPHYPFEAPEEVLKPYLETGAFTRNVAAIYAMVEVMDRGIALVLEEVDRLGLRDNTLVMFSSDNGPQMLGRGAESTVRFNCGFNGAKGLVWEGGIRLPMILRWPAGLDGGGRAIHDLVHFTDWLPTLLTIAGGEPPRDLRLDGESVLPLLRGERGKTPTTRFWQWNRYRPDGECNAAMRDGRWKLVRPWIRERMHMDPLDLQMDDDQRDHPENYSDIRRDPWPEQKRGDAPRAQLFDIVNDPYERDDLAAQQPERVSRMSAELARWFEEVQQERATIDDVW